jgi:putative protease
MNQLGMVTGINAAGIIMTVSETSVRAVNSRRGGMFRDMEVVWALPPVIQEAGSGMYRRLVSTLAQQGYRNFQAGNLAHIQMLQGIRIKGSRKRGGMAGIPGARPKAERRLKIYGDYTLNLLNSQAVRAARDLGVALPQITVETDAGNAGKVLGNAPRPVFFTAFAWIPLFTSRLSHSSYAPGRPVSSMRDEVFYWQKGNGAWVLLPHRPFSLIRRRHELKAMGFSALIIDLANWPVARKIKKKQSNRFNIMDILSRGREFNFSGKLW